MPGWLLVIVSVLTFAVLVAGYRRSYWVVVRQRSEGKLDHDRRWWRIHQAHDVVTVFANGA
jgi:hypothetical protein